MRALRTFYLGDVFANIARGPPAYDYFFLDAEHTASFAERYVPLLETYAAGGDAAGGAASAPRRIVGSVHDVYGLADHFGGGTGVSEVSASILPR